MAGNLDLRKQASEFLGDLLGIIAGAVVHNDHFVDERQRQDSTDNSHQGGFFVIGRNDDGHRRGHCIVHVDKQESGHTHCTLSLSLSLIFTPRRIDAMPSQTDAMTSGSKAMAGARGKRLRMFLPLGLKLPLVSNYGAGHRQGADFWN
jgi:hypothetical protein